MLLSLMVDFIGQFPFCLAIGIAPSLRKRYATHWSLHPAFLVFLDEISRNESVF